MPNVKQQYITQKQNERAFIKKSIKSLNQQRITFVAEKKKASSQENALDNVIVSAIRRQAQNQRFVFPKN